MLLPKTYNGLGCCSIALRVISVFSWIVSNNVSWFFLALFGCFIVR